MVQPPRGSDKKRGVFATRSPHRPNPIGMSVLDLQSIQGLRIDVGPNDLLNGTPILDVKPYLPYVDAHLDEKIGWLQESADEKFVVSWSPPALEQLKFLESLGVNQLQGFAINQLEYDPDDSKKKRLYRTDSGLFLAYRTWRLQITVSEKDKSVTILNISSGYSNEELDSELDTYNDKGTHKLFVKKFKT